MLRITRYAAMIASMGIILAGFALIGSEAEAVPGPSPATVAPKSSPAQSSVGQEKQQAEGKVLKQDRHSSSISQQPSGS